MTKFGGNITTTGSSLSPGGWNIFDADYWNRQCDPRTVHYWLMNGGPWKMLAISAVYLFAIPLGVRWMRRRVAYQIRTAMFAYNLTLIATNVYFLCRSAWWTDYGRDLLNFRFPPPHDRSARAQSLVKLFYYYHMSKFLDYFDTFFFVLRKKNAHISLLHVYHHASVPLVGWLSNWISPTMPVLGLFAALNSFCHTIMYSYYALASLGPKIQPYLWWKKYITQIQLIQFMIIGLYGILLNVRHHGYPLVYRLVPISQGFIYLFLFGDFYCKSYKRKNTKANGICSSSSSSSSSSSNGNAAITNDKKAKQATD